MGHIWACCMALFLVVFVADQEAFSLVQPVSLEELVHASDVIIVGKVESVGSHLDTAQKVILSTAVVKPIMILKGELAVGLPIKVEYRGGKVDDIEMKVSEAVKFGEGEEAVLFLIRLDNARWRVCGRFQGKYRIGFDEDRNRVIISPLHNEGYDIRQQGFDAENGWILFFEFINRIRRML